MKLGSREHSFVRLDEVHIKQALQLYWAVTRPKVECPLSPVKALLGAIGTFDCCNNWVKFYFLQTKQSITAFIWIIINNLIGKGFYDFPSFFFYLHYFYSTFTSAFLLKKFCLHCFGVVLLDESAISTKNFMSYCVYYR